MCSPGSIEARIHITGRVQGVGFRPFIYRLAIRYRLRGYVLNLGDAGVEVVVEGLEGNVESFIKSIQAEAPPVSEITKVYSDYKPYRGRFKEFEIDKSINSKQVASGIFPPDIGICPECIMDMEDHQGRWFEYPFTACAWCGPRFTGVKSLPYDRERTHMEVFPLCKDCKSDYKNPVNRRFDAQGITCSRCGPRMSLHDASGKIIKTKNVFEETTRLLNEGNIIAVKGIGGFHIAVIATDDDFVAKLRLRKNRPYQPFALMSPDLKAVKSFSTPDIFESRLLTSWQKPIVLVKTKEGIISELVAPGLGRVGVMLPYTGIQVMLFKRLNAPAIVMTSGNKAGLPMAITNEDALNNLRGIADYFLFHNREIVNRCDDSLMRINEGQVVFIRRSRGYVPDPIEIPLKKGVSFALGTEQSNTAAVTLNGRCYQTQYLGDTINLETLDYEKNALYSLCNLLNITRNPDVITCDKHYGYMTSQLAEVISQETGSPINKAQHHHAHTVSVCAENSIKPEENVIGITLDGAGYGSDGAIWGGEVLISNYFGFTRVGHLEYLPMPGGDLCTIYPYRMLISGLTTVLDNDEICDITESHIKRALPNGLKELEIILKQARDKNVLKTSSSGRFLDSVASLLGLTYMRTYEGEPAMRLETLADLGNAIRIKYDPEIISVKDKYELKTQNALKYLIENKNTFKKQDIAAFVHQYLAIGISNIAMEVAKTEGINTISLSGGVLVNRLISSEIKKQVKKYGFKIITNNKTSPGDGGVSLGQSCISLASVI